jgi:O-antigen/teichoic acid export membrane protein
MLLTALYSRARTMLRSYNTDAGRHAARNLVGTVSLTILGQLCALGTMLVLTNTLGTDYGIFSYAHFAQQYLVLFTTGALAQMVVRDAVHRPGEMNEIETSFLLVSGVLASILSILVVTGACLVPIGSSERLVLIFLALGNIPACMNVRCWYEAHHRQTRDSFISLFFEIGTLAVLVGLRLSGELTLTMAALVYALKWAASSLVLFAVYHFTIRRVRFVVSRPHILDMLHAAWPLMLASLVAMVPFNSGGLILRIFRGPADAAVFGVALQVALAYLTFAQVANRIVRPHILGKHGLERSFLSKLILFKTGFLGLLLAAALCGAFLVIRYFMPIQFHAAIGPTALLLAAALLTAVGRTAGNYMVLLRSERIFLLANAGAALTYLAAVLILVPALSYTGSALATLAASLIGTGFILGWLAPVLKKQSN